MDLIREEAQALMPVQIIQGNCADVLDTLDVSVQCTITSPPYFQLRDYGIENQIGGEHSPEEYVSRLSDIFLKVNKITKDDGVLWLNLGDVFLKKQLLCLPFRVAMALKSQGWLLRADCIWERPDTMPESAKDRPTR